MKFDQRILLMMAGAATSLAVALGGACGQGPLYTPLSAPTVPGGGGYGTTCPPGTYLLGATCVSVALNFTNACLYAGGYPIAASGANPALCEFVTGFSGSGSGGWNNWAAMSFGYYSASPDSYFPRITPSTPANPTAFTTTLFAFGLDRITFSATGKWGNSGGDFRFSDPPMVCHNGVPFGYDLSLGSPLNEGQPEDLFGAVGTDVFPLGGGTTHVVAAATSGYVRIGFNVPMNVGDCFWMKISQFSVTHCADATNTTYACP